MPPTEDSMKKKSSQLETDSSGPKSSQEDKESATIEPNSSPMISESNQQNQAIMSSEEDDSHHITENINKNTMTNLEFIMDKEDIVNNENIDDDDAAALLDAHVRELSSQIRRRYSLRVPEELNNSNPHELATNIIVAGKIQKISLQNFMSDESKEIVLNDKVNVFVGSSGSGKSGILTALAVGLGANLNRFRQDNEKAFLQGLIKHGEVIATIEISLSNVGTNAYEPDVYGETIKVCTTIDSHGSTAYKIQNFSGETVSTEKSVLEDVLKQLNIQVDNPICILNQEFARTFLIISTASKMYEFFLKATQIDELVQKLESCETDMDDSENCLFPTVQYMIETEKKIRELEASQEVAQPEENLRQQLIEQKENYDKAYEGFMKLQNNMIKRDERLKIHKKKVNMLMDAVGQRVQYCFQEILRMINYQGRITIDHEQKTLDLEVIPVNDSQYKPTDADALSGDLLAKIAFFLALLDCNSLPFSFLDEFDVLMNNDQRCFAMGMVLEYMKRRPSKQFGFLTPLNTAHIESDDNISIYKFADLMGNPNN